MLMAPLFVTTQNTMQSRYTQSQVVYLGKPQKSLDFTKTNLAISCYIERVIILIPNINKAKKFEGQSNMAYYENISYFHCTFSEKKDVGIIQNLQKELGLESSKEVLSEKDL